MSETYVLELNDADVCLWHGRDARVRSPGFARVRPDALTVGREAWSEWRRHPREVNNRFFSQLSLDPLRTPGFQARTHADLAYAHLRGLWAEAHSSPDATGDVVIAVPASLDREQLGVLLGVTEACPFRTAGLVDHAVASATTVAVQGTVVHVSFGLHAAELVLLAAEGDEVRRVAARSVPDAGLHAIHNAWVGLVADTFIAETRFDPLHGAETEQALFSAVDRWVDQLARDPELQVELASGRNLNRVRLERSAFESRAGTRYGHLVDALATLAEHADAVLLSAPAARLPGLESFLSDRTGLPILGLRADACAEGIEAAHEQIVTGTGEVRYLTRLLRPLSERTVAATATETANATRHDGDATAIRSAMRPAAPPPPDATDDRAPAPLAPAARVDRAVTRPAEGTPGRESALAATHLLAPDGRAIPLAAAGRPPLSLGSQAAGTDGRRLVLDGLPGHLCDIDLVAGEPVLLNRHPEGTRVNGVLVHDRHVLVPGDRIEGPWGGVGLVCFGIVADGP